MKNKNQTIEYLQKTLSGIMAGSQQHFFHAIINRQKGFNKLAERMLLESKEEMDGASVFIQRIIELGGIPEVQPEKWPVLMDVQEQLNIEYAEQELALTALNGIINSISDDDATKQLFQEYLQEETAHTQWLKQQLDLIKSIGLQNYLASQI